MFSTISTTIALCLFVTLTGCCYNEKIPTTKKLQNNPQSNINNTSSENIYNPKSINIISHQGDILLNVLNQCQHKQTDHTVDIHC